METVQQFFRTNLDIVFFVYGLAFLLMGAAILLQPKKLSELALARDVWISFGDLDAELSDNAFDLLPGETKTLHVKSAASLDALQHALYWQTLADAIATSTQAGTPTAKAGNVQPTLEQASAVRDMEARR